MKYSKNILETIGDTPLVKLNTITKEISALVLAKVESFNPGNSIKDRMAVKMVQDAEADGRLKPGGVIHFYNIIENKVDFKIDNYLSSNFKCIVERVVHPYSPSSSLVVFDIVKAGKNVR